MMIPERDAVTPTPTPRRNRAAATFEIGADNREDTEDEDGNTHTQDEASPPFGAPSHQQGFNEADVIGVTLDDDDFESHYSRHESSESEGETEEGEMDDEDDVISGANGAEQHSGHQNGVARQERFPPTSQEGQESLSRVRSLPARPPLSHSNGVHSHPQHQLIGLHASQSTTSLPPPPPPPLYPPFYNRPPTPLPPSPSLTSLLRPPSLLNRSTASTRPTTPDSSDVETPNDTEAAVAHSARRANPPPPTSPKVPTYEYYGFVLYLASTLAFLIYILWSYLPSPFLHALGITYYPNRWWSLAIPAWIVMLLIFVYIALLSYNVEYLTLPLANLECMVDDAANVAILDDAGRLRKGGSKRFVKDMEERAKLEREMESIRSKGGKGRKYSKNSGSASSRSKDKGKRKSSRAGSEQDFAVPQIPTHGNQVPASLVSPESHYPYHAGTYPFLTPTARPTQSQYNTQVNGSYPTYPNWKLVWNEGTDAVMDVPIGGVCEVLYG